MSFHATTSLALTLLLCLTSTVALHQRKPIPRHPIHPPSKGDGPYTVAEWDMGSFLEPPPEVNFHMHFWIPITNSTLHPKKDTGFGVLIFQSAFAGNVPVELYDTMFARISSNGFIVVGLDRLQGIDATREAGDLHEVIQYLNDNFNAKIREQGYSTIADMSNLLLGSHSAAGHVITAYISKYGCGNVKAMMMMDPVDGYDPWGIVPDYIITPGNMVNFTTPLLHIDNGYDPRTMGMFPACSPAFMSNDRFYNAWNGPKWQINGTRYGHGDILDGDYAEIAGMMCDRDTTLTQDELQIWRTTCGDAITSFFNAVINHEIDELDYIESEKYIAVESVLKHEYNGYSRQDVAGGFCFHEGDDVTVKAKQVHKHKKHHHHQHDKKH